MASHSANAAELATWLEQHPGVERVLFPFLESHPQHELAKSQMVGAIGTVGMSCRNLLCLYTSLSVLLQPVLPFNMVSTVNVYSSCGGLRSAY